MDDHNARGTYATPGLPGLAPGASMRAFSPLEDPTVARRAEVERATSTVKSDGLTGEESNILFVDGLPTDCTRREVSRILFFIFLFLFKLLLMFFSPFVLV